MAEPASKLILDVVKQDCSSNTCPYRYGDQSHSSKLTEKLDKKLKHRVADGNEVRALERRVKELEAALTKIIDLSDKGKKMNLQDITQMKNILLRKKTDK